MEQKHLFSMAMLNNQRVIGCSVESSLTFSGKILRPAALGAWNQSQPGRAQLVTQPPNPARRVDKKWIQYTKWGPLDS